jgi:hypothetical protein
MLIVGFTSPGIIEDPCLLVGNTVSLTAHLVADTKSLHKKFQIIL